MKGLGTLLLVSLLAAAARAAAGGQHGGVLTGAPQDISETDAGLQRALVSAVFFYNNMSNSAFLFRPSAVSRAQRQVVQGFLYLVDLNMTRTVCRKRDRRDPSSCDFQPEGDELRQTFQCHTEVWLLPWEHKSRTLKFTCRPRDHRRAPNPKPWQQHHHHHHHHHHLPRRLVPAEE